MLSTGNGANEQGQYLETSASRHPGERRMRAVLAGPASLIRSLASFDQHPQAAAEASGDIFDGTPHN